MELSNSNIKKISYISGNGNPKKFLIFSLKKAFFIFSVMKPCTFQPKLEKQKFLIF